MPSARYLPSSTLFAVLIAIRSCGNSYAEPILLTTFSHAGSGQLGTNPPPTIPFEFEALGPVAAGGPFFAQWLGEHVPSDAGMTFLAPADIVQGVNRAMVHPTASYRLRTGFGIFSEPRPFDLSFAGHTITSIERKIDKLVISSFLGNFGYEAAQTIRFFGEPIPPLPGDFNRNGAADLADYVLWRNLNNQPVTLPNESGLNPGSVDIEDYWFWKANFGRTSIATVAGTATQNIPEPRAQLLLLFALSCRCLTREILDGLHRPKSHSQRRPIHVAA